jgi:hypothetical protein
MEQNMVKVHIKAIAGFVLEGKSIAIDDVVEVSKGFAREMVHAHKAVVVRPEPPAAAPALEPGPQVVAQSAGVVQTQDPPVTARGKTKP